MASEQVKYLLRIKVVSNDERIKDFYCNFHSHHIGDSGIDLIYYTDIMTKQFKVATLDFGIQCEMIDMETREFVSYYLVPRSSISKTPYQLANSIGIIDAGYRGNLMAKVRCFEDNGILQAGSYFQIIAPDLKPIKINIVNELSSTTRNDGGFGSTDKS